MSMTGARAVALVLAGALASSGLGIGAAMVFAPPMVERLDAGARQAIAGQGVRGVDVRLDDGRWLTRHAVLRGGERLSEGQRTAIARAVAAVPGMGGVHWMARAVVPDAAPDPLLVCQTQVDAILKARSIRFADASAHIDPASRGLLDEVAAALDPCAGSVIAITGHTNATGDDEANLALSRDRAFAVRNALGQRGIDIARLRARGLGSQRPVAGLDPADPANRRIEFSVIAPVSVEPTVIDTPGPGNAGDEAAAGMPIWVELQALLALTYGLGISIGWAIWGRTKTAHG